MESRTKKGIQPANGLRNIALAGFLGGVLGMFLLTQVARISHLLAPMDNLGLLKLDLLQASAWGVFAAAIAAVVRRKYGASIERPLQVFMTIVSLFFLVGILGLSAALNGALTDPVLKACSPLVLLGPVSAWLTVWCGRGVEALSARAKHA